MIAPAQAQYPVTARRPFAGGYYGAGGRGVFFLPRIRGNIPEPPYFSVYPPVYYSYAVPRTYGYSPFAYPGWFMTPDADRVKPRMVRTRNIDRAKPRMITNTYVKPQSETTAGGLVAAPRMITNPFVESLASGDGG
jgi:hypothetical protein